MRNEHKEMRDARNGTTITASALTTTNLNPKGINLFEMTNRFKNKTKHLKYIILLFIVGALGACDKQTVYHASGLFPKKVGKDRTHCFLMSLCPTHRLTTN